MLPNAEGLNGTTEATSKLLVAGANCTNDGHCKPGLSCCDAVGGNKCWECCENIHCEAIRKVCW